jgi:hypothetical protein
MSLQILVKNIVLQSDKWRYYVRMEHNNATFEKCIVIRKTAKYLSGTFFICIKL